MRSHYYIVHLLRPVSPICDCATGLSTKCSVDLAIVWQACVEMRSKPLVDLQGQRGLDSRATDTRLDLYAVGRCSP